MNYFKTSFGALENGKFRTEYITDIGSFYGDSERDDENQYHEHLMNHNPEYKKNYDEEMAIPLNVKEIKITNFCTGSVSMVGVHGDFPLSWGNYWGMIIEPDRNKPIQVLKSQFPVLNIWNENWEEARKRFFITELNAYLVNGLCVIINKEIPDDWYLDDLFLTYNLHRGMSRAEKDKLRKWYDEL